MLFSPWKENTDDPSPSASPSPPDEPSNLPQGRVDSPVPARAERLLGVKKGVEGQD